jgi:crossover junction endodeoxyribonuclease RuvC
MKEKIILGIDPGFDRLGVAIIKSVNNKNTLLFSDCLTTNKKETMEKRLASIYDQLRKIINIYKPEKLGIESLFLTNNQKTVINVAKAIGVILLAAAEKKLEVLELSPVQVKQGITGDGRSDKKQVEFMVRKLIKVESTKKIDDEMDAIAIAIVTAAFNTSL